MADRQYANEAKTLIYDPDTAQRVIVKTANKSIGDSPMERAVAGSMAESAVNGAMTALKQNALGTFWALYGAHSLRVQLAFSDGRTEVVDLNPQDESLTSVADQCAATLRKNASVSEQRGIPSPTYPLSQPKSVDLLRPIRVYLSASDTLGAIVAGNLAILGQIHFSPDSNYCIVRAEVDNRTRTAIVGVNILGAALDPSQRLACYMPHGGGGTELPASN
jgi:hypothetical protein